MSHDSNAMRLAGFIVISLVGYWAFIEAENYEPGPARVGPGAEACGNWSELLGLCQSRATHTRAEAVNRITEGYRTE